MTTPPRSARELLDLELPPDHLDYWTGHVARAKVVAETETHSVVVFRVYAEWLALPTALFSEIAGRRPIHPLPQRRHGAVLGLVNIRGELLPCLSLAAVLGLDARSERRRDKQRAQEQRLLVLAHEGGRSVCPADEVYGIQRFHARAQTAVPATLARAAGSYVTAVLPWQNKSVGLLDPQLLAYTLNRSLASATAT